MTLVGGNISQRTHRRGLKIWEAEESENTRYQVYISEREIKKII